ncbi:MAG: protein-L-isoaspartate(D-aspartate) O-methyltransferase [Candidatus Pacearchaeota archaeon]
MNKKELLDLLRKEGFSEKIINAFSKVNREIFVPDELKEFAYENHPLPIGYGQTISQPYTIAFMLSLLDVKDGQKILEVGSGSGYVLALINELSKNLKIFGVEIIKELYEKSKKNLKSFKNIKVFNLDGTKGLLQESPFDRIIVSASADEIPRDLIKQLKTGGIMVIPVLNSIFSIKKEAKGNEIKEYPGFVFVPLRKDRHTK